MSDTIVLCITFGTLLLLNIISLILMHCTKVGRYFYSDYARSKREKVFINIYMIFVGITFWFLILFHTIRFGRVWKEENNE